MLIMAVLIVTIPFIIYNGKGDENFGGSDDKASQVLEQSGYTPWIKSLWTPPSPEMESLLFAVQAAIGALIIGYFLGYYNGKRKNSEQK